MKLRPWGWFGSDVPDDTIEDGDVFIHGGKAMAEVLGQLLVGLGCSIEHIDYEGFKGWWIWFRLRRRLFQCRVVVFDRQEYSIVISQQGLLPKMFGYYWPELIEVLQRLSESMNKDPRFRNVRWQDYDEVDQDGPASADPISPDG